MECVLGKEFDRRNADLFLAYRKMKGGQPIKVTRPFIICLSSSEQLRRYIDPIIGARPSNRPLIGSKLSGAAAIAPAP